MSTMTITRYDEGAGFGYVLMLDGRVVDNLCCDEALGVVAQWLMTSQEKDLFGGFKTIEHLQKDAVRRGYPKHHEE